MSLGIVEVADDRKVTNYVEKPTYTYLDSMGIYVYEPKVIEFIKPGVYLDLPALVTRLIENGESVFGYFHDSSHYLLDIG